MIIIKAALGRLEFVREWLSQLDVTPVIIGLVAAFILLSRLVSLLINPEPWLDEAMLLLNFMTIDWAAVLHPLPLFEQSAPLGYVMLGKAASLLGVSAATIAMRCLSAVASISTALIFFQLARRVMPAGWAAVATCMMAMNYSLTFYGIEIKQFGVEALCTIAIMSCATRAARRDADVASLAMFAAVGTVALAFSFTVVLAIAGFGGALFIERAAVPKADRRALIRVVVVGGVLAGVWALAYLGYARDAVSMHISGYPERYARGLLQFPPLDETARSRWVDLLRFLENRYFYPTRGPLSLLALVGLVGIGWTALLVRCGREGRLLATGSALFFVTMIAGAVAGVFTPYTERHFVFATPVVALLLASGIMTVVVWAARLLPPRLRPNAVAAMMLLLVLAFARPGVAQVNRTEREPLTPALQQAKKQGGWPGDTWVFYTAQPAVDLAEFPGRPDYLGRVPHESVPTSWFMNARRSQANEVGRFEREFSQRRRIFLLYSHLTRRPGPIQYHFRELEGFLAAAEALGGRCSLVYSQDGARGEAGLYRCER